MKSNFLNAVQQRLFFRTFQCNDCDCSMTEACPEKICDNNSALKTAKKVFKHDTEAGRLLSRLYGFELNEPEINYPTLKSVEVDLSARNPWNQKKKETKNTKAVKVPKFGQGKIAETKGKSAFHVSSIPRRKTKDQCIESLEEIKVKTRNYRPPAKVIESGNISEKDRLSDINSFGGGKALPDELTMPKQTPPSQIKEQHMKNKLDNYCTHLSAGDDEGKVMLADQIVKEIEERRKFQLEMETSGMGQTSRDRIVTEISDRMVELMSIDWERANMLKKNN